MPKRKLTKHEDDIRRGLRPVDRYEPRARSIGGPWKMVKCKDGAYVCAEQHDEVVEYLRKSAENSPPQSPHDGIHTCSRGCSKPGCNRTLRDTIDEQNIQIEALKRDLLEATADKRKKAMETIHDINQIGGLQEENARLKAEVERLTAFTTRTIIPNEELLAQVERLTKAGDAMFSAIEATKDFEDFPRFSLDKSTDAWEEAKQGGQP